MRDFKVPTEFNRGDQIAGFTFPQLGILGGAFAICGIMFASSMSPLVSLILSVPIGLVACFFAFRKKMNIPIYEYYIVKLSYIMVPKRMVYRKENKRHLESTREEIAFLISAEQKEGLKEEKKKGFFAKKR